MPAAIQRSYFTLPAGKRCAGHPHKTPVAAQPWDGAASRSFSLLLHNAVGISKAVGHFDAFNLY